jgi:hypothetical protein
MSEDDQAKLGHTITGIANCVGLVGALLFGFLFEKKKIANVSPYR